MKTLKNILFILISILLFGCGTSKEIAVNSYNAKYGTTIIEGNEEGIIQKNMRESL